MRSALVRLSNRLTGMLKRWNATDPGPRRGSAAPTRAELEIFALRRPRTASSPARPQPGYAVV
jgi:hypothetical protein